MPTWPISSPTRRSTSCDGTRKSRSFSICHTLASTRRYQAKQELIEKFRKKAKADGHADPTYAAMIASVDESVGRVVATLDELGLAKNTLVIFASDNGGVGGYERDGIQGKSITDNAPLHGGKGMLYEGGIRVPYIFRWPGVVPAGVVCDEPINSVDLYPTLAGGGQRREAGPGRSTASAISHSSNRAARQSSTATRSFGTSPAI